MWENVQNLAQYAAHVCGIYAAYMQHIFWHISGMCSFEWWRII